ncbi:hypothetical protein JCM8097_004180 [Rhodosporidiobolus ruineniae]
MSVLFKETFGGKWEWGYPSIACEGVKDRAGLVWSGATRSMYIASGSLRLIDDYYSPERVMCELEIGSGEFPPTPSGTLCTSPVETSGVRFVLTLVTPALAALVSSPASTAGVEETLGVAIPKAVTSLSAISFSPVSHDVLLRFPRCGRELWTSEAVLSQSPYFELLLSSGFAESSVAEEATVPSIAPGVLQQSDVEGDHSPGEGAVRQEEETPAIEDKPAAPAVQEKQREAISASDKLKSASVEQKERDVQDLKTSAPSATVGESASPAPKNRSKTLHKVRGLFGRSRFDPAATIADRAAEDQRHPQASMASGGRSKGDQGLTARGGLAHAGPSTQVPSHALEAAQETVQPAEALTDDSDDEVDAALPAPSPPPVNPAVLALLPHKTITITEAAYSTYAAVVFYLSTDSITFSRLRSLRSAPSRASPSFPAPVSPKSVYRLAHVLELDHLAALALANYAAQLSPAVATSELFSPLCRLYPAAGKVVLRYIADRENRGAVMETEEMRERIRRVEEEEADPSEAAMVARLSRKLMATK